MQPLFARPRRARLSLTNCAAFVATRPLTLPVGRGDSSDICKSSKRASGSSIEKKGYWIARGSRESSSTRRNR
jgi:hypothetical protein